MYFKILRNGSSCNGGHYEWARPHDDKPGAWSEPVWGKLVACHNGYHIAEDSKLFDWCSNPCQVYICEKKYKSIVRTSKIVARSVRLIKEVTINKGQFISIVRDIWSYLIDEEHNFAFYRASEEYDNAMAYANNFFKDGTYFHKLSMFMGGAHRCGRTWEQQSELEKYCFDTFCKHLGLVQD